MTINAGFYGACLEGPITSVVLFQAPSHTCNAVFGLADDNELVELRLKRVTVESKGGCYSTDNAHSEPRLHQIISINEIIHCRCPLKIRIDRLHND